MTKEKTIYSFWIATKKVLKNGVIFLLPSLIAYQTSVDPAYAATLSVVIYYVKNYLANKS